MNLKVIEVTHYTDKLFKIKLERPSTYRFVAGEFTMIGLDNWSEKLQKNKPIMRA
jgi:ferredoxin--NADP+ reductase